MRRYEAAALREFFTRFQPFLMREAYSMRIQAALCDEAVTQCLDDAAVSLMRHTMPIPRSLAGYLLTGFRHDVINARRDERQRQLHQRAAVREGTVAGEWIVPEASSEHALRASRGPAHQDDALDPVLARLAATLDEGLTADERRLLTWVGHWVPQRLIASWLGIGYGAVRARVLRLRDRLRGAAARYAGSLSAEEQRELQRFFRRTTVPPALRRAGMPRVLAPNDMPRPGAGDRNDAGDQYVSD
jgi:DNA-directed RNA polymerase specialized sigma24 family protein